MNSPKDIYPGLRETGAPDVETITLPDLLEQVPLDDSNAHMLVLDTSGQDRTILEQLRDCGALDVMYERCDEIATTFTPRCVNLFPGHFSPVQL